MTTYLIKGRLVDLPQKAKDKIAEHGGQTVQDGKYKTIKVVIEDDDKALAFYKFFNGDEYGEGGYPQVWLEEQLDFGYLASLDRD